MPSTKFTRSTSAKVSAKLTDVPSTVYNGTYYRRPISEDFSSDAHPSVVHPWTLLLKRRKSFDPRRQSDDVLQKKEYKTRKCKTFKLSRI